MLMLLSLFNALVLLVVLFLSTMWLSDLAVQ
jgi:hypothetical protein